MLVIKTKNYINFLTAKPEEKLDYVLELIDKQKELTSFTIQNVDLKPNVRVYLEFVIVICNDTFCKILFNSIKNEICTMEDFLALYSKKLDQYIIENMEIDFMIVN